ncbi:MAG: hypothetical protein CW742_06530 [Methanoregula sp.]|nr:MAG: hypothetical protein CW742_06530 [Methanoregula sp.]
MKEGYGLMRLKGLNHDKAPKGSVRCDGPKGPEQEKSSKDLRLSTGQKARSRRRAVKIFDFRRAKRPGAGEEQ